MTDKVEHPDWPETETGQGAYIMYGDPGLREFIEAELRRYVLGRLAVDIETLKEADNMGGKPSKGTPKDKRIKENKDK